MKKSFIPFLFLSVLTANVAFGQIYLNKQDQLDANRLKITLRRNKIKQADVYKFKFLPGLNTTTDSVFAYTYLYDNKGNTIKILGNDTFNEVAAKRIREFTYDTKGDQLSEVGFYPDNAKTYYKITYKYDNAGHVLEMTYKGTSMGAQINTFNYDKKGNLIETEYCMDTSRKQDNRQVINAYDSNDKLTQTSTFNNSARFGKFATASSNYVHKVTHTANGEIDLADRYDSKKKLLSEIEYDYDKEGNEIRTFRFVAGSKILLDQNKFDQNGRLIEHIQNSYRFFKTPIGLENSKLVTTDRTVNDYDLAGNLLKTSTYKNDQLVSVDKWYYKKF